MTAAEHDRGESTEAGGPHLTDDRPHPGRPPAAGRVDLTVPYAEKDVAKRLGARWDPITRVWYVPPGTNPALFARWSSRASARDLTGPTVRARVLALSELCYRCARPTCSIVGVLVSPELTDEPDGFIPFDDVAAALATRLDRDRLAELGIGALRQLERRGEARLPLPTAVGIAIQGCFPLHDALIGHRVAGGGYEELVVTLVDLPAGSSRGTTRRGSAPRSRRPSASPAPTVRRSNQDRTLCGTGACGAAPTQIRRSSIHTFHRPHRRTLREWTVGLFLAADRW